MASGAAWMVSFKIIDRGVGIVSTAILARLLVPEEFGLISLASSVIAILELLGAFGLESALVQRTDANRTHFDAVWTFNIAFGICLGLLVAAVAEPTANFYGDPRLVSVMLIIGLRYAIGGFENVGIVMFRKELNFEMDFKFMVTKRLITSFLVAIPLAFFLRNYWALLAGSLAGTCISVALSYAIHPYRPRLSFTGLGELMGFYKWLFRTSLIGVLDSRSSSLIVGRWAGPAALGSLSMAREIASIASRELAAPINRAAFPAYSKMSNDRELLQRNFLKLLSIVLLLTIPAGVGLGVLAEPIVLLMLGERWTETVPLIRLLALNGVLGVFLSTAHHLNLAVGMARSTSLVIAGNAVITIPVMVWLVPTHGSYGAAAAALAGSCVTAPLNIYLVGRVIKFGAKELFAITCRPVIGCLVMVGALITVMSIWTVPHSAVGRASYLIVLSIFGGSTYFATVWALWRLSRNPESGEAWILEKVDDLKCGMITRLLS